MYTPPHFAITDIPEIHRLIREHAFATLVTTTDAGPLASHLPVVLDATGEFGTLRAHIARANPQWRAFDGATTALFIFQGPHAYISPSWYSPGPAVPTWDYVVVHATGRPHLLEDESKVLAFLGELVETYESGAARPWRMGDQSPGYLAGLSRGIVAFEMAIERLEGKAKLGQNRPMDQLAVASKLEAAGDGDLASAIRRANGLSVSP